jgi:hypothetical protein
MMNRFVDAPCPALVERGKTISDGRLIGTRWLYNPQVKKWYMVKACPHCSQIHKPKSVRDDRLVISPRGT